MDRAAVRVTEEPKYAEIIQSWEAFWSLEDIGRPLWLVPSSPAITPTLSRAISLPQLFQDKEVQLEAELGILRWREAAHIDDDFVPHVQPYGGVTVFASAFGCDVDFFEHTMPWAHPAIRQDDPAGKVYDLAPPAVTDGQLGDMLAFTDYFVAETGGRYPVAITDMQGPLDTAYMIWEPSAFMLAMYDHPEEVHHLMRLVTDLIIRYVKEQRARSPEFLACHYPPLWLPDGRGISVSDDGLAVISAKLYREFCLPYMNEISEEFGGVMIHSCGDFTHQLDNLGQVRDLRGINFGVTETSFEAVWERFGGRTAIIPHLGLNNETHFEGNQEYLEHVLKAKTHSRGLCVIVAPANLFGAGATTRFSDRIKATLAEFG